MRDGWHGLWDVSDPWVQHRDLWMLARALRADLLEDLQVCWINGRQDQKAMAGRDLTYRMTAFGNGEAHRLAGKACGRHPSSAEVQQAVRRTAVISEHLAVAYARVLEWALAAEGRMPEATPMERIFRLPRPPRLPDHLVLEDSAGTARCIRCLMPARLTVRRRCRPAGTLGHTLASIGGGVVCMRCGAYGFSKLELLTEARKGRPADAAADWRRRRMLKGRHPCTGAVLDGPRLVDIAADTFMVILG